MSSTEPIVFDHDAITAWVQMCEEGQTERIAAGLAALIAPSAGAEVAAALACLLLSPSVVTEPVEDPDCVDVKNTQAEPVEDPDQPEVKNDQINLKD